MRNSYRETTREWDFFSRKLFQYKEKDSYFSEGDSFSLELVKKNLHYFVLKIYSVNSRICLSKNISAWTNAFQCWKLFCDPDNLL